MRRHSPFMDYNRGLAMFKADPDRHAAKSNALQGMAENELQMVYLLVRWAGCTDVGYAMHGVRKTGDAFVGPTRKQVTDAWKAML